jgi:HEPN domain-containing protein
MSLDLLNRAEEFFQAFKDLPSGNPPCWPRYFMLCHAIELALKAYLVSRGTTTKHLKNTFGHDLKKLLSEAINAGLPLGPLARGEIELLNEAHAKYWPRYPKEDSKPVFIIDPFEPYAAELIRAVAKILRYQ